MARLFGVTTAILLLATSNSSTYAELVASQTSGGAFLGVSGYVGQSFTSVASVPETNIVFNLFSDASPAKTLAAFGDGFLLSQQFLGKASNLSSSTPGFLGEAVASGGTYSFGSSVTLQPLTQYFFYENANIPANSITGGASYSGGSFYYSVGASDNFVNEGSSQVLNFEVTGSPLQTPEPSSLLMTLMALPGLCAFTWRRSWQTLNPLARGGSARFDCQRSAI